MRRLVVCLALIVRLQSRRAAWIVAIHDLHQSATPVIVPTNDRRLLRAAVPQRPAHRGRRHGRISRVYPRAFEPGSIVIEYVDDLRRRISRLRHQRRHLLPFRRRRRSSARCRPMPTASVHRGRHRVHRRRHARLADLSARRRRCACTSSTVPYDFIGPNWLDAAAVPGHSAAREDHLRRHPHRRHQAPPPAVMHRHPRPRCRTRKESPAPTRASPRRRAPTSRSPPGWRPSPGSPPTWSTPPSSPPSTRPSS